MNTSLVEAVITIMSGKTGSAASIAALVERRDEGHFTNRIGGVLQDLIAERNNLRAQDEVNNTTLVKDMAVKPEAMLNFCQSLQNSVCWAARRFIRAQEQTAIEESLRGITGIDFSQDVADELNIEPVDTAELELQIMEDFDSLSRLHSVICKHMTYLNHIDPLYLFADKGTEDENWRILDYANTFTAALDLMIVAQGRMKEREEAKLAKELTQTDFTKAA